MLVSADSSSYGIGAVVEQYISLVIDTLPITDVMIDKVLSASAADDNLRVITFCITEWPDDVELLLSEVQPFWHSRDQLTVQTPELSSRRPSVKRPWRRNIPDILASKRTDRRPGQRCGA
jgi:hypothetical protein